jgi:hypothetical protein
MYMCTRGLCVDHFRCSIACSSVREEVTYVSGLIFVESPVLRAGSHITDNLPVPRSYGMNLARGSSGDLDLGPKKEEVVGSSPQDSRWSHLSDYVQ